MAAGTFGPVGVGERRCHAHKKSGEQCKKWGIRGTEPPVCRVHGGAIPQVQAAAAARLELRKTRELAARVVVDPVRFASPAEAAGYSLTQIRTRLAQISQVASQLDSMTYVGKDGRERVRPAITEQRLWADSMSRMLAVAVSAASAASSESSGPDPVEMYRACVTLFREDVDSALTDVGATSELAEAVNARLAARAMMRIRASEGLIDQQIRTLTQAARGR
jgi:hypothetical protein